MTKSAGVIELDRARLKRDLHKRVADAKSLLQRQSSQARQILIKLIEKPLVCEAIREGGKNGYPITGQGSYLNFLPDQLASAGLW